MENVERAFLRHKLVRESRVCFILNCFRVVWLDLITTNFCFSKLPTMLFCRHFIVSFKLGQPRVSCQPQIVLLIAKYHITTYFYAHHIFFNSPHLLTLNTFFILITFVNTDKPRYKIPSYSFYPVIKPKISVPSVCERYKYSPVIASPVIKPGPFKVFITGFLCTHYICLYSPPLFILTTFSCIHHY